MVMYWRSWVRIVSWFSIYVFVLFLVAEFTESWLAVGLSGIFLLALWVFIVNVGEIYKGRGLKKFLVSVAREAEITESTQLTKGYVYFSGHLFTAAVDVSSEGVFIYSAGICVCLIPWEAISSIKVIGSSDLLRARIRFVRYAEIISISWKDEFKNVVPEQVRCIL